MPQQFAWLITGTFENKTLLREGWQALKYFFRYIIGLEKVCTEPFLWRTKAGQRHGIHP